MKVEFKDEATVKITPETFLENYALQKWFEGYNNHGPEILEVVKIMLLWKFLLLFKFIFLLCLLIKIIGNTNLFWG